MRSELIELLSCPVCGAGFSGTSPATDVLICRKCDYRAPIIDGIPRFVFVPEDQTARRTQASFGYEWTHFNDWSQSAEASFKDYFAGFALESLRGKTVLDAGCGMGRHAREMAQYAGHVVALDFSRAIDQAAANTRLLANVDCIQADVLAPPVSDGRFDLVYSLGVLHHIRDTEAALIGLVKKVRPGGHVRIYLYWKRHGWKGSLLAMVALARKVTTRLPFRVLKACCWMLSVLLWTTVVTPYRLLSAIGVNARDWPLFFYTKYPFVILYNDQFDRFSAPIEKRYDANEVKALMEHVGLRNVVVRPCFGWIADGQKES